MWPTVVLRETVAEQHPQFESSLNPHLCVMSPKPKLFLTWWRHKWEEMPALCPWGLAVICLLCSSGADPQLVWNGVSDELHL